MATKIEIASGITRNGESLEAVRFARDVCDGCLQQNECDPQIKINFDGGPGGQTWMLTAEGKVLGDDGCGLSSVLKC